MNLLIFLTHRAIHTTSTLQHSRQLPKSTLWNGLNPAVDLVIQVLGIFTQQLKTVPTLSPSVCQAVSFFLTDTQVLTSFHPKHFYHGFMQHKHVKQSSCYLITLYLNQRVQSNISSFLNYSQLYINICQKTPGSQACRKYTTNDRKAQENNLG